MSISHTSSMSGLNFNSWWTDEEALHAIKDYIFTRGLLVSDGGGYTNLSVTLKPSPFPRDLFQHATSIQMSFNMLLDVVSQDDQFLRETFQKIVKADEFVKHLFDIYNEVQKQGNLQVTTFGVHRSDYLVDFQQSDDGHVTLGLKQVEINTVSTSLSGHGYKMNSLHKYIQTRYSPSTLMEHLDNHCLTGYVDGIATAWKEYDNDSAIVLFVVGEKESNIIDHREIEFNLWERYSISTMRRTLRQVSEQAKLTQTRTIIIDDKEIAVAYYRTGYIPEHYPSDKEWEGRRLLELSKATNCPSIPYHLVGLKKTQQVLSNPNILERYCTSKTAIENMRSTFTGLYTLDQTPEGDKAVQLALQNPHRFVMKPQREGGGNNLYGEDVRKALTKLGSSVERDQYILMDRINAPSIKSVLLKKGETVATETKVINELGIYGIFVRKGDCVLMNTSSGHLVRSKPHSSNEGGVAIGIAALDSPWLVSSEDYIKSIADHD